MDIYKTLLFLSIILIAAAFWSGPRRNGRRCRKARFNPKNTKCPRGQEGYFFNRNLKECFKTCDPGVPFETQGECNMRCRSKAVCGGPRAIPSCSGKVYTVFYFDEGSGACLSDKSCIFTGNNFPRKEECIKTCKADRKLVLEVVPIKQRSRSGAML
uniref:Putative kunitz-bpti protein n=1 Tax=Amblyomma americanum TaxID=6943 RepID=A0A0C9R5K2_AMBAM